MLNFQYHRVLSIIAKETFPEHKILPFKIEIHPKEMKTRHGDYHPRNKVIRIFNLSQKVDYTISTALHELAHHCEFSIYGSTGHSKQFYGVFKHLLETAVMMGVVDYEIIRKQENANDINVLEKHFGPVMSVAKSSVTQKETVLKILNSYSFRNELSDRNYFYDNIEKAWGKIIPTENLSSEISYLKQKTSEDNIIIRSLFDLKFEAIYYIFVPGGFQHKDKLKNNGYFFKELKKKKGWAKKLVSTDLDKEKQFLQSLRITDYNVSSSLI